LAHLYDLRFDPRYTAQMLYPSPTDGQPVGVDFLVPQSVHDLQRRRRFHQIWAEATFGLMGRTTDFLSALLTAFSIHPALFGEHAEKVKAYYAYVRDNDLFLTHTLVDPPIDRSKPPSQQRDPYAYLAVVQETSAGLIMRGAKAVATASPYADEILVLPAVDARPGFTTAADQPYAVVFALPTHTPGLRFLCREPFGGGNRFDHPLASHLDEMDGVAIFDDVLVPWDRVFINQDAQAVRRLTAFDQVRPEDGHAGWGPPGLIMLQVAVRLVAKLQLAVGLARRGMQMMQRESPFSRDMLAEITISIELINALILAAEATARPNRAGVWLPNPHYLNLVRVMGPWWYPRAKEVLQLTLSTGLIYQPGDVSAFDSPVGGDIQRYFVGAEAAAEERLKVFKAAADLAISAFGGRQELYERFYGGDPFALRSSFWFNQVDWSGPDRLVDACLDAFDVQAALKEAQRH
jgi:4-hydroxyphenylacetate 3-monooxygenase